MKLGLIVDGHDGFISELLEDWQTIYSTFVFSFQEINLPLANGRVNNWRLQRALSHFIKKNDVIFCEWAGPLTITLSHFEVEKPVIVRLHSWELYEYAVHINWDSIDKIVLVSQAMRQKFIDLFPAQAEKALVIPSGKPLEIFCPVEREFRGRMAMLCDMVPIKRVYDVILTVYDLQQRGYTLELHLGGEPRPGSDNQRYYVSMQRAIEKLGIEDLVYFHGWVDDTPAWLQQMDIFISNSYWEGQQNALIEALAVGCYGLSHFWDGVEEMLPEEYIYVSSNDLINKITQYCGWTESERRIHRERQQKIVRERFDVDDMLARFRKVLKGFET